MSRLTIGALAAAAGVKLETIRFYERVGVMPKPDRTEGGHRSYTLEHRKRLTFVRRARELGFSLDDVRTLLDLSQPQSLSCAEAKSVAATHLGKVRAKIADLVRLEGVLADTVSRCDAHADPSCPLIEMLVGNGADPQSIYRPPQTPTPPDMALPRLASPSQRRYFPRFGTDVIEE